LMAYGVTAQILHEVLPIDDTLAPCTIREHVFTVAERLEQQLGEEQWSFIDGSPAEWSRLPIPNGPLTVGIDGGYVRAQGTQGWFEVIAGKGLLSFTRGEESQEPVSSKCFAFVQTYDQKPKRRLFEVLQSQGHQLNQQITFLSDGGDTVRELQLYLNPHAEHLLDWFHVTMRLTALQQTAKGLPEKTRDEEEDYPLRAPDMRELERLTWFLWHGNVYKSLQVVQCIEMDPDAAVAMSGHATARKLLKAMEEFHTYIENNKGFIPNYGERYRHGERISTGFVESTVNQVISKHFCKKQQMAWTPRGANLLLPIRTRVLNGDWEATFREWYPGFRTAPQPMAACPPQQQTLSYLSALYQRLATRRGKKRAIIAVAHSIVVSAFHMLIRDEPYRELGAHYFDDRRQAHLVDQLTRRIERLGYRVTLEPVAAV
jgi:hypothetical protein